MTGPAIDLGVHHAPEGFSDRVALGFAKGLRWTAPRQPHVELTTHWKKAA